MPSSALRLRDLRSIHELVSQCRDLGDDCAVWRRHWFAGLAALVGADLVLGGEMGGIRGGAPRDMGTAEWGWENGFDRAGWVRALELLRTNPGYSPLMVQYAGRVRRADGVALSGSELVPESQWVPQVEYQQVYRTIGVHHNLWCFRFIPGRADEAHGQILARAAGRRDFTGREKAVVAEAYAALTPLLGGPLARFAEPSPDRPAAPRPGGAPVPARRGFGQAGRGPAGDQQAHRQPVREGDLRPLRGDHPGRAAGPVGPPRVGEYVRVG
jgi:hypothetical protein